MPQCDSNECVQVPKDVEFRRVSHPPALGRGSRKILPARLVDADELLGVHWLDSHRKSLSLCT